MMNVGLHLLMNPHPRSVSYESKPEANVVVAVARRVVVAIRYTAVTGIVVPTATTNNPVGALLTFNTYVFTKIV